MNIFPTKKISFRLTDSQEITLDRLKRRTEHSISLTSQFTDKSFRGVINGNEFKIISSAIGRGAFCVMTGAIETEKGNVKVEIHKVFRILLSVFLLFPIIGLISMILTKTQEFSPIFFF